MEVLRNLDVQSVEQVIAVPEISLDFVHQRSAGRRPQTAEQLVEVPTERGYVFAIIATKALGGGEQRHLPNSSGGCGSLQDSRAGQGSSAADVEQIARGGLQGFLPGQGSSSMSRLLEDTDDGIQGGFRTFPQPKKSAESSRQSCPRVPASASSSELSAARESDEPGGALNDAAADLQRWRRELRRRREGAGGRSGRFIDSVMDMQLFVLHWYPLCTLCRRPQRPHW